MSNRAAYAVDGLDTEVTILHMAGVEGPSVYINDRRVGGPKPWGGGRVVKEWHTTVRDLLEAIVGDHEPGDPELQRLAREDALGFHRERRRRQTPRLVQALTTLAETQL